MTLLDLEVAILDLARSAAGLCVNWSIQSTLLILGGLVIGYSLRRQGSAVQSAVYRTTLVAVLACPLATWGLSQLGVTGYSLEMPKAYTHEEPHVALPQAESARPQREGAESPIVAPSAQTVGEEFATAAARSMAPSEEILSSATEGQSLNSVTPPEAAEEPAPSIATSAPAQVSVFGIRWFGAAAVLISAAWIAGTIWLLARLIAAWRRLGRIRRCALRADLQTVQICQTLVELLRVAPPDVLHSPYVPSPCLAGLRRPAVMLPDTELGRPMRDVLIHELAHLARRDGHWNLLRRVTTSLYFFQPLIWALSRRLDSTAEEVCDDYVVQFGGNRHEYAHRLVDFAELSITPVAAAGVGIVSSRSLLATRVARIMDTSRSLSTRVGYLLLTLVLAGGLLATALVGLVGIGPRASVADAAPEIVAAEQPEPVRTKAAANVNANASSNRVVDGEPASTDTTVQNDVSQVYEGKVVDPAGQPVEGAELYLVFHVPQPTGLLAPTWKPIATTDAAGAFRFTASPKDFGIHSTVREFGHAALVAVKDGFGFAWSQAGVYETSGDWLRDARARLIEAPAEFLEQLKRMLSGAGEPLKLVVEDQPIRGRILDIDGQPVVGARLTLLEVSSGIGDDLTSWRAAAKEPKADYYSARMKTPMMMNGPQVRSLVKPVMTDDNGRFALRGVGRGRIAELLMEGPGIESAKIFARTEAGETIELLRERRSPDLGSYLYYPAELTHVAGPSTAITGVVHDARTKAPLAGVTIKSQSRHGERISGWGQDFIRAVTDKEGRYRLEGMPIGSDNRIAAIAPVGDVPYISVSKRAATASQEGPLVIDFEMRRGVWIEGRITDKQTGKGLAGGLAYYVKKGSPSYEIARSLYVDERDRLQSNDDGYFRIAALPGPGFITFSAHDHQNYPRADVIVKPDGSRKRIDATMLETGPSILVPQNYHIVAEVDPAAEAERVELDLQLDGGNSVLGHVVDPDGKPVTDFYYAGQFAQFDVWKPSAGERFELKGYDPKAPRHVYFAHGQRKLAGHVVAQDDPLDNFVVKLQPAGKVQGRLVDEDGSPLPNCQLVSWSNPLRSLLDSAQMHRAPPLPPKLAHWQVGQYETDDEGRFEISCLAPGVEYRLRAVDRARMTPSRGDMPRILGPLDVIIQIEPGESKNLGDVRLADEAEFTSAVERTTKTSLREPSRLQRVISGRISLAGGKPAADAHIAVIGMRTEPRRGGDLTPGGEVLAEATTDANGNFELSLKDVSSKTHNFSNIVARKNGFAIAWQRLDLDAARSDVSLELPAEELIQGRLIDIEGQPAAGVRILVQAMMKRSNGSSPREDGIGVGYPASEQVPAAWLQGVTTDAQGRFTLSGVPAGYGVFLNVVGSDRFAPQDIALNTGMPEQRGERDGTYRPLVKNVEVGSEAVLPLAPAQLFDGVVTYQDTGQPAPHARLTIWASQQEPFGSMISVAGIANAEGRYRISPYPGIRFGVTAYPPDGVPYLARRTLPSEGIRWESGDHQKRVDVALPRGVLIRGRIVESGTDTPVAGASIQYVPEQANNPNTADDILTGWQGIQLSNGRGEFEIAVLPGPGRLLVHGPRNEYVIQETTSNQISRGRPGGTRQYAHHIQPIDVTADQSPLEMSFELRRGSTVRGTLVDESGDTVDEALMVSYRNIRAADLGWRGHSPDVMGGHFEMAGLVEGEVYSVHFLDAKRRLGATAMIRAEEPAHRVVLKPCGAAVMRLVDKSGKPVADLSAVNVYLVARPGADKFDSVAMRAGDVAADSDFISNIDRINYRSPRSTDTDAEGRIKLPVLIPGAPYRIVTLNQGKFTVVKDFVAASGETADLGDLVVEVQGD